MYHRSVSNSIPQNEFEYTIKYFLLQYQNTPPIFKIIYLRSLEAVVTYGLFFFFNSGPSTCKFCFKNSRRLIITLILTMLFLYCVHITCIIFFGDYHSCKDLEDDTSCTKSFVTDRV